MNVRPAFQFKDGLFAGVLRHSQKKRFHPVAPISSFLFQRKKPRTQGCIRGFKGSELFRSLAGKTNQNVCFRPPKAWNLLALYEALLSEASSLYRV